MFEKSVHKFLFKSVAALLVLAFAIGAAGVPVARAAGLTVTNLDDSGTGSLRQAITDALPGDTITFDSSLAGGTITLTSGQLVLDKALTISGPGADQLAISGNNASRVMEVTVGVTVTIQGLTITNGYCSNPCFDGSGIMNRGTLSVTNSVFSNNTAHNHGGAIQNNGTLNINNSTFSGNRAEVGDGGAIRSNDGTVSISNTAFIGNSALQYGGGAIRNNSGTESLTISNSTFRDNTAITDGGAIQHLGVTLDVTDSTFYNNSATFTGGAIRTFSLLNSRNVNIQNSTFVGNDAPKGGGIYYEGRMNTLTNSTFISNSASSGGGIYLSVAMVTLTNTVIANNPSGGNCILGLSATINDGGGNLVWGDTICPGINADPMLGALQNNGGLTETMALLDGSPAIDAAIEANCPTTDQRGMPRPLGVGCDIGAYEVGPVSIEVTPINPIVQVGQTLEFLVSGMWANGTVEDFTGEVTWSSSLPAVAALSSNSATAVSPGVTEISARLGPISSSTTLTVIGIFNFSGFLHPVDNLPTLNTVKAGQGVPVKFSLGGDQGLNILAAGYPVSQPIACDGSLPLDTIEQTVTASSNSLSYDAATGTYTYVWKSERAWAGTCRQLIVKLSDGTEHKASFKFK